MFVRLCTQEGEMWGSAGGLLLAGRRARTVSPSLPKGFYVNKGLLWSPGRLTLPGAGPRSSHGPISKNFCLTNESS